MNKKIIVVFIMMLLIATTIGSSTKIHQEDVIDSIEDNINAPVWELDDSWTFSERENQYRYNPDGTVNAVYYNNYTSTYTVTDETENTYTVEMTSENNIGSFKTDIFHLIFTPFTKITGRIEHKKTDLSIVSSYVQIKGLVKWYLPTIGISIPAYFSDTFERSFSPSLTYIPFPLSEGKTGTNPGSTMTGGETMELYFGVLKLIDVEYTFDIPGTEYQCDMATITIPEGTYQAYNISTDEGVGNFSYSCYVPELGQYAKQSSYYEYDETGKTYSYYQTELVSTTYQP